MGRIACRQRYSRVRDGNYLPWLNRYRAERIIKAPRSRDVDLLFSLAFPETTLATRHRCVQNRENLV
jgi:hypothetical protein